MVVNARKDAWFWVGLLSLCFLYFGFECFNNAYAIWSVDDFWFAHRIYQFGGGLPYRDFSPYKTVLGYYFLLPTMLIGHDALTPLFITKHFIAGVNTLFFGITGVILKRIFPAISVLLTLALIMFSVCTLSYSTNIRVDLLAYWFCLFSALCLLEARSFSRFICAGILLGIGFLISQKALWYIVASNAALGAYWLLAERTHKLFWGTVLFNCTLLLVISVYIFFWAHFSSLETVLHNVFYEAAIMYRLDTYSSTRAFFWTYTLTNNPLIFLAWPLGFLSLLINPENDTLLKLRLFIVSFTAVILFCLIPYKQVFPYYMLTALPSFILLYCALLTWLFALLSSKTITLNLINQKGLLLLVGVYLILFCYINWIFGLSPACWLIAFIPSCIIFVLLNNTFSNYKNLILQAIVSMVIIIVGFIYPLSLYAHSLILSSGAYQRSMVKIAEALLQQGGDYLAGIELFHDRNQPIPGLRHLDMAAITYLYKPTPLLATAMLDSLYHTPDITIQKALTYLDTSSVKFYVNNYRIAALPSAIKHYLHTHYQHYWGSIYLYAPLIEKGLTSDEIKFSGWYLIQSKDHIILDHKTIKPLTIVFLDKGTHTSQAAKRYRLVLQETGLKQLDAQYQADHWAMMLG